MRLPTERNPEDGTGGGYPIPAEHNNGGAVDSGTGTYPGEPYAEGSQWRIPGDARTFTTRAHAEAARMAGGGGDSSPTRYVAGWNLAGYLPEEEPAIFETLQEAADYLAEEAARWADQDSEWEGAPEAAHIEQGPNYADGWYGEVHLWAEPYTHTHYGYGEDPRVCAECGETY